MAGPVSDAFKTGISVVCNRQPLIFGLGRKTFAGEAHCLAWDEEVKERPWWLKHHNFQDEGPSMGIHIMSKIWAQFEAVDNLDLRSLNPGLAPNHMVHKVFRTGCGERDKSAIDMMRALLLHGANLKERLRRDGCYALMAAAEAVSGFFNS